MYIIGGKYKRRKLFSPKGNLTRPTSAQLREALFNICQPFIENALFLDLFAGSGAIGLEALSRGARHVTFVERDKTSIAILKKNIHMLSVEKETSIYPFEVFQTLVRLSKKGEAFDLIFADPPYGDMTCSWSNAVLDFVDLYPVLAKGGMLFLEDSKLASKETKTPRRLKLLSSRTFGRGVLRQYGE